MLGMGDVPDSMCQAMMAHLAAETEENILLPAIRGERAGFHWMFEDLESGRLEPLRMPTPDFEPLRMPQVEAADGI